MKQVVGIFEAKTHFSEICETVARTGEEVVVARRGQSLVRIVPVVPELKASEGVLARMRRTEKTHGPIGDEGEDFPEVWETRRGRRVNPLEDEESPRA